MTLLSVVKDVCAVVGVLQPTSVFSGITGNRTMQEMVALANEMAQRIAYDTRDWGMLKAVQTYNGDGVIQPKPPGDGLVHGTTSFPLPANFKRLLLTANVWRSTNYLTPMRYFPDTDQWLNRRTRNIYDAYGEWTIMGGNMLIAPVMGVGMSCYYGYLDKNCVNLTSGGRGDSFMADTDTFALDERILKLGMIWQWKAQKGAAYSEDLGTYGDALTSVMGRDSPAPILLGHKPMSAGVRIAYPWQVPTQ